MGWLRNRVCAYRQFMQRCSCERLKLGQGGAAGADLRLVMTLLVRDEADVVEGNVRFHLDHGVDFIVATDNGSTDGTTEILEEYAKKGVLHLIREPSRAFDQQAWVNRMGEIAYSSFSADMIFHADADEIWLPSSGSLKRELSMRQDVDVLYAPVRTMLLADLDGKEKFPIDIMYEVRRPLWKPVHRVMQEVDKRSFLLYRYPDKVIYRMRKGYLPVTQGNHDIVPVPGESQIKRGISCDIQILHFPIRGLEQFIKKTVNSGEGLENLNREKPVDAVKAWHVKRWYGLYKDGRLLAEYRRLTLSQESADLYARKGVLAPLDERKRAVLDYFR
jgi:glycosyltransferase involved in cell wall biosynthesis